MDDTTENIDIDKPNNPVDNRNPDGTFGPNNNANPKGRPKGKTMKEYAREFLMSMDDEAKKDFLNSLSKDIVWRMAEGNPHQTQDITSKGEAIIPIYGGNSLQGHNSDKKDLPADKEDTRSIGGNVSQ